jgi:hypothetical protein
LTDPASREREVTEILGAWNWDDGACLVGGYAVSAYGKPRYSRDLDFVIPTAGKESALRQLAEIGFLLRPPHNPQRAGAFLDAVTLERGRVSIDLMVGYVRDRETKVVVPQEWIVARKREIRLVLLTGSTNGTVRVCRPEALWALKIVAGRDQDLADLFAICSEPIDIDETRDFLRTVGNVALRARIADERLRLDSGKILSESLSARFLPSSTDSARKSWVRFKRLFTEIVS